MTEPTLVNHKIVCYFCTASPIKFERVEKAHNTNGDGSLPFFSFLTPLQNALPHKSSFRLGYSNEMDVASSTNNETSSATSFSDFDGKNAEDGNVNDNIEKWLIFAVLCLVTLMAIFGNFFIMLCIMCNRSLQRPGHLFIASLAFTDLLLALTVMVPRLLDEILGGWHFGFLLCQVKYLQKIFLLFFQKAKFRFALLKAFSPVHFFCTITKSNKKWN